MAEHALLQELEVRYPERYPEQRSSPAAPHQRTLSTIASIDDGDREQTVAAPVRGVSNFAREKTQSRLGRAPGSSSPAGGLLESPLEIHIAEPVRCVHCRI